MMDVMDSKTTRTAAVLLCCLAAVAFGAIYTWTGDDTNCNQNPWLCEWQEKNNWDSGGFCTPPCYPGTTNDDAIVDELVTITMTQSETIDDLEISGSPMAPTTFTTDNSVWTLDCDSITISGAYVKVQNLAALEAGTEPCPEEM